MKRIFSLALLVVAVACARGPSRVDTDARVEALPSEEVPAVEQGMGEAAPGDDLNDLLAEYDDEMEAGEREIADPIKPWNVVWFHFNDKLHFWLIKPASKVYKVLLYPRFIRKGIRNFIINLGFPGRFFNTLLQGNPWHSGQEVVRFIGNLTVGGLGFWDPATHWWNIPIYWEDFDQTLGVWGMGMGFYIVWPILGSSSVRGTLGSVGNNFLDPVATWWPVVLVARLNMLSLDLDGYETFVKMSVDPYSAIRNGYVQFRKEETKSKEGTSKESHSSLYTRPHSMR